MHSNSNQRRPKAGDEAAPAAFESSLGELHDSARSLAETLQMLDEEIQPARVEVMPNSSFNDFSNLIRSHLGQEEADLILNRLTTFGYSNDSKAMNLLMNGVRWFADQNKPITRRTYEALLSKCLGENYSKQVDDNYEISFEILQYMRSSKSEEEKIQHQRLENGESPEDVFGTRKAVLYQTKNRCHKFPAGSVFKQPGKLSTISETKHLDSSAERSDEDTGFSSSAE